MRAVGGRSWGSRTRGTPTTKLKAIFAIIRSNQGWHYHWITNYERTWFHSQIGLIAGLGANCVKFCPDIMSYIEGGADAATMSYRLHDFCTAVSEAGLLMAWMYPVEELDGTSEENLAGIQAFVSDIDQYPNVVHIDCMNEINFHNTVEQSAVSAEAIVSAIREVSEIPVTASLNGTPNDLLDYADALDPWLDFHDFHSYTNSWADSSLNTYRARSYARPLMLGEYGVFPGSQSDLAAKIEDVAETHNADDVYGTCLFPIGSYTAGAQTYPGFYDNNLENLSTACADAFDALGAWV